MSLETLNLTKNQQTVLDILESASEPLKAYTILFDIQKKGIKSPLQVYRALDKLIEIGKVHKIESRNSYVACKHEGCNAKTSTSFLICEKCDNVTELIGNNLFGLFQENINFVNQHLILKIYFFIFFLLITFYYSRKHVE